MRRELDAAVEATAANRGLLVNLAINYGGRAEIVDAVNAILDMARLDGSIESLKLDEDQISTSLYTADCPDPDLLIRTSGEMRISNFLLWQIAYAELYVTETLWPDFSRTDLLQAVLEYQKRDRRYGGLSGAPAHRAGQRGGQAGRPEPARSAASGMKRLLTAAALIPIVVYVVLFANFWVFLAVLIAVAALCYHEYDGIAAAYGFGAPGPLGYGFGAAAAGLGRRRVGHCRGGGAGGAGHGDARPRARQCPAPRRAAAAGRGLCFRLLEMRASRCARATRTG